MMKSKLKYLFPALTAMTVSTVMANELEEVVVQAHPLSDKGLSQSIKVLTGDALNEELQSSLGETLATSAGLRSASFGGAVGRPVIHGLGGARVKTTEDRIDSLDVSVTSGDHAVTVEPFIADQITVLKGASSLLYGSGAIGGVVDTQTGRIARQLPEQPITGRAELRFGDNADTKIAATRMDGRLGDSLAWHIDAYSKEADDYEAAGALESAAQREREGESLEGLDDNEVLVGSRYKVRGGAAGLSYIGESGFIGASISTIDSDYGLVGGHGHEEEGEEEEEHEGEEEHEDEGEEEPGVIDLEQTRFDLEAQLDNPFSGVKKINARIGINDYTHQEVEPDGEVATVFENDAWEGRIEVTHEEIGDFSGAFGLQLSNRDFSAVGEEAFVPPVSSDSAGLFWVGERQFDSLSLEVGARIENTDHDASVSELRDTDFSTFSSSIGLVYPSNERTTWSFLIDYSERAPSIEELYSDGPHLATQSFEIGDDQLEKESGLGATLTWNYLSDNYAARATVYHTEFDDFIYLNNTGGEEDGLPVFIYQQNDARFTGVDLELEAQLGEFAGGKLSATALFDTVDAKVQTNGSQSLPRIPSDRIGVGLAWQSEQTLVRLKYSHTAAQNEVAEFELPTPSYDEVSLYLSHTISIDNYDLKLFVSGRNLLDEQQREHTSFVKDVAPAPGRRFEAGLRFRF